MPAPGGVESQRGASPPDVSQACYCNLALHYGTLRCITENTYYSKEVTEVFEEWNYVLQDVVGKLMGQAPPKHAFLSETQGGLNLFLICKHRAESYIRCKDFALRQATANFPQLKNRIDTLRTEGSLTHPLARSMANCFAKIPPSARSIIGNACNDAVNKNQDKVAVRAAISNDLIGLASLSDKDAREAGAKLHAAVKGLQFKNATKGMNKKQLLVNALAREQDSGAWMTTVSQKQSHKCSDVAYKYGVSLRLGLEIQNAKEEGDVLGRKALRMKGAARNDTHNALVQAHCVQVFEARGENPRTEVIGLYGNRPGETEEPSTQESGVASKAKLGRMRRVDLLSPDHTLGQWDEVDVTVIDCAQKEAMQRVRAVEQPLHSTVLAEKRKLDKYSDHLPGHVVRPLALGIGGEMGKMGRAWLAKLAEEKLQRQRSGGEVSQDAVARVVRRWRGELGLVLMRAQAEQLLRYALLPTERLLREQVKKGKDAPSRGKGKAAGAGPSGLAVAGGRVR